MAAPFDIYKIATEWGACPDERPAVVVRDHGDGRVLCALISSAMDLYEEAHDFLVEAGEPGFEDTGLIRTSYVSSRFAATIDEPDLVRKLGVVSGSLRERFTFWWSIHAGFEPG